MRYIRIIVITLVVLFSTSCIDNLDAPTLDKNASDAITIIGRCTRFDDYNVNTRSPKDEDESHITSYAMAIFPIENNAVGNCVYYEVKSGSQLLFNLDRSNGIYDEGKEYAIYIFANMPNLTVDYDGIGQPLSVMLEKTLDISSSQLNIPADGFPMIGSLGDYVSTSIDGDGQNFIMAPSGDDPPQIGKNPMDPDNNILESVSTLQIPMKALFAKVNFEIEVRPDQVIEGGFVPQFELSGCDIVNVPRYVDFKKDVITKDSDYVNDMWQSPLSVTDARGVASGANKIRFSFYLPENLLEPAVKAEEYQYPFGKGDSIRKEDEKYRQRYKVKLLGDSGNTEGDSGNTEAVLLKQATHIVLSGEFKDHQSHTVEVKYTIYLGKDNFSNFDIVRNAEYNNYITIRGVLNSADEDKQNYISIDHRVNVKHNDPVIISLRREVLLDSHFEVRPLRIEKNDALTGDLPTHVKVSVDESTDWMRLERSFGDGSLDGSPKNSKGEVIYITEKGASYGKRRYFTHNLITGANKGDYDYPLNNSTDVIIPLETVDGEADKCVWIYVDEVYPTSTENIGDGVRSGNITITYWKDKDNDGALDEFTDNNFPPITYTISQRKLFDVQASNRSYYIEYFEEYLHNFDADEEYGHTHYEGMEWGLNGINLSYEHEALFFDVQDTGLDDLDNFLDRFLEALKSSNPAYYDYYIKTHDDEIIPKLHKTEVLHEYAGYDFCNEIIQVVNGYGRHDLDESNDINKLALNEVAKSAIEYCYNKNKRYDDGRVVKDNESIPQNLNWYLPSTDEIEDIVMSTYDDESGMPHNTYGRFLDFQDKFYWSSQPAYVPNCAYERITFLFFSDDYYGDFYYDDYGQLKFDVENQTGRSEIGSARATKVKFENNQYKSALSGTNGYYSYYDARDEDKNGDPYVYSGTSRDGKTIGELTRDEGNRARNELSRVRCVRKQPRQQ